MYDLTAFVGKLRDLREWKVAPGPGSIVVCPLTDDLGLVPATGALFDELVSRFDRATVDRLERDIQQRLTAVDSAVERAMAELYQVPGRPQAYPWELEYESARALVCQSPNYAAQEARRLLEHEAAKAWAAKVSVKTAVAYVKAGYFGGQGSQWATVWADGRVVLWQVTINEALRHLGVTAEPDLDEFDTVGLGRHRSVESWAAAAE
jgi:hypothetical protein